MISIDRNLSHAALGSLKSQLAVKIKWNITKFAINIISIYDDDLASTIFVHSVIRSELLKWLGNTQNDRT